MINCEQCVTVLNKKYINMKIVKYKITVLLLCFFGTILAQQTPGLKQSETISITGVTAHIGNGEIISNCTIIFENGKIKFLSKYLNLKCLLFFHFQK